jgi:16S rRNA (guanine527-N7)-methyltransferase
VTPEWIATLSAEAASIGVGITDEQARQLGRFADRLIEWGAKMDLSSITDAAEIREKHFVDSLTGLLFLPETATILDVGSGAGFPGLVLAAIRPGLTVTSIESRSKKCAFQRQVIRDLGLRNATVETTRAEEWIASHDPADWVTARALSSMSELLGLTAPWRRRGTRLLAYKSSKLDEELRGIEEPVERHDLQLPASHDPRTLVIVGSPGVSPRGR